MEDEKKLYPFQFCPIEDKFEWGEEVFHLADLGYRDSFVRDGWLATNTISEVMETFIDRFVGENAFNYYGLQFPFQIKKLHVTGNYPLLVCPNDEIAEQRYDALGKDKVWYVEKAEPGAGLLIGFAKESSASEVYEKAADGTLAELLRFVPAKPGQFARIAPGTVHGIKGRVDIIEISESSPIDMKMEGENLCEALDFIDYGKYSEPAVSAPFSVKAVRLDKPETVETEGLDSCICYTCLKGEACVQCRIDGLGLADFKILEGETMTVPAEIPEFAVLPLKADTLLIETIARKRVENDSYVNPDSQLNS